MEEYDYAPMNYGFEYSNWAKDIADQAGTLSARKLSDWQSDLAALNEKGAYYFSICVMALVAEK